MNTPFEIESFEERLNAMRHDLSEGCRHHRGFVKQSFPDLDGIARWLRYRVFESERSL